MTTAEEEEVVALAEGGDDALRLFAVRWPPGSEQRRAVRRSPGGACLRGVAFGSGGQVRC